MQVILLQDRKDVRDKITFLIESSFNSKVFEANTVAEAVEIIRKTSPPVNLILFDLKTCSENEKSEFWSAAAQTPVVYCIHGTSDQPPRFTNAIPVTNPALLIETLVKTVKGMVGPAHKSGGEASGSGANGNPASEPGTLLDSLCRIRTSLLLTVSPLKGDIFVKLGDKKFIKVFSAGDVFDRADMEKYTVKKGIEYLYIRREDCVEFADKYRNELQKLLASDNLTLGRVEKLGGLVHEVIQELHEQIGFTKEVQDLAKSQVQLTLKAMGKDPNLAEILKKLRTSGDKYIASHSMLCSYLSCAIAKQLKWSSSTTYYKLTLASFLHDITLNNNELAALTSLEDLERNRSRFTESEFKAFKDHPVISAEMARRMSEVPPDVDTIIAQHHENSQGTGFPRKMGASLVAPLAAVFIVAHDLTQFTLKSGDHFNAQEYLKHAREKFTHGHFKKVLSSLEALKDFSELTTEPAKAKAP